MGRSQHAEVLAMETIPISPMQKHPHGDSYQDQPKQFTLNEDVQTPLLVGEAWHTGQPEFPSPRRNWDILHSSTSSTIDSPNATRSTAQGRFGYRAKVLFWATCKSMKLPMIYHLCSRSLGWSPIDVKTDISILYRQQSGFRNIGLSPNLIHVIALLLALALILLNASSLYLGGELPGVVNRDSEKLFGLQFAAKIHELLMLASIGSILSTYVRMELGRSGSAGLPVGALFAPFQFQNISFLLSTEMTGVWLHEWKKTRRKALFIGLVFTCCILGIFVGPSSATLMRPRLDIWAAGGTSFWLDAPEDELYTDVMTDSPELSRCLVDSGDLACPAGNWQILNQAYFSYWPQLSDRGSMPGYLTVSSPFSGREFRIKSRGHMIWASSFTIASAPLSPLADAVAELGRLWSIAAAKASDLRYKYRQEAYFRLEAQQPVVFARCEESDAGFPVVSSVTRDGGSTNTTVGETVPFNDTWFEDNYRWKLGSLPTIIWVDEVPLMERLNSSIAAIVNIPREFGSSLPSKYCCSMRAAFASSSYQAKWSLQKVVSGWPSGVESKGILRPGFKEIAIEKSWARYLNPSIQGTNNTAVASIMRSAGLWNTTTSSTTTPDEIIVENVLAVLLANGISRTNYNTVMRLDLLEQDWTNELVSSHTRLWAQNATKLGNAFKDPTDLDQHTRLEFHATVYGHSFNWTGKIQLMTVAVLVLYACLVFVHIGVFAGTGRSWAGWNSLPEAATIIINSLPPETLRSIVGPIEARDGPVEGYMTTATSLKSPYADG